MNKSNPLELFWNLTPKLRKKVTEIQNHYVQVGNGTDISKLPYYYCLHFNSDNLELWYDEAIQEDADYNFLRIGQTKIPLQKLSLDEIKTTILKNI